MFDTRDDGHVDHFYPEGRPDQAAADVVVEPDTTTVVDTDLDIDRPARLNTSPPTPPGGPVSGQPYTATHGTWVASSGPTPTRTYTCTWTHQDGKLLVRESTNPTYVPTVDDEGHLLRVTVRAEAPGYLRTGALVESPTPVARGIVNVILPSIVGTAYSTLTVTARPGTWSPGGLTLGYQWRADGKPIAGATARSFTIPADMQLRSLLSVRVTAFRPGKTTVSATSRAMWVLRPTIHDVTPPTIGGRLAVGSTLTGRPGIWTLSGTPRPPSTGTPTARPSPVPPRGPSPRPRLSSARR